MIPALLGLGALVGAAKTIDALDDMSTAKSINNEAKDIAQKADTRLANAKKDTDHSISELGKTKIGIMSGSMKHFVDTYSKIKNMNFKDSVGIEELRGFNPNSDEFKNLKNASFKASEIAAGGLGGIAAGTLTAAGAYGAVGAFAAASTGTAISALGGAAATNATLAWLGGGAIAAGGGGIAAGTAVLGGLVAAPALLVTGFFLGSKAETALNDARANRDKARKYEQEIKNLCTVLDAIKSRANQIDNLLNELNKKFYPAISRLNDVLEFVGDDYLSYSPKAKDAVMLSAQLAKTIKIILDTSLFKENATLNDYETKQAIDKGRALLAKV